MSLSNRLRPDVEAAPWVIKEVIKLEEELDAAWIAVDLVKKENERLREALSFYTYDWRKEYDSDLHNNKAFGFKLVDQMTGNVYGEVWTEGGKKIGQCTSYNIDLLRIDLKNCTQGYEYKFVDDLPEFLMIELRNRSVMFDDNGTIARAALEDK